MPRCCAVACVDRDYDWDAAEQALMAGSLGSGAAAAARAVNKKKKKPRSDAFGAGGGGESDSSDSDSDNDAAATGSGAAGSAARGEREKRKITTKCWFINPRYFVDVVRYRLYLMRLHLERLSTYQGGEAMFRCSNPLCTYQCSVLEAQQRRTAEIGAASRGVAAVGGVTTPLFLKPPSTQSSQSEITAPGPAASAAAASYAFRCPLCSSSLSAVRARASVQRSYLYVTATMLVLFFVRALQSVDPCLRIFIIIDTTIMHTHLSALLHCVVATPFHTRAVQGHVDNTAAVASRMMVRFDDQMRASGLLDLLKQLDAVRLGANRPSDLIRAGKISLHGPAATKTAPPPDSIDGSSDPGKRASSGGGGGGGASSSSSAARMISTASSRIEVEVDLDGPGGRPRVSAAAAAALAKARVNAITPATDVAVSSLPAHMQRSGITGEQSRSLGFVSIRSGGGGGGGSTGAELLNGWGGDIGSSGGGGRGDAQLGAAPAVLDDSAIEGARRLLQQQQQAPPAQSSALFDVVAPASSNSGGIGGPGKRIIELDRLGSSGSSAPVHDTNINADLDNPAAGDEGAAAPHSDVTDEMLWRLLFMNAQAGVPSTSDGTIPDARSSSSSSDSSASSVQPPAAANAGSNAAADEEEWEDA